MVKLLGISGSLRKGSYNTALLNAALACAPEGVTFEAGTIRGIPLYDGDVEKEMGIPQAVATLKQKVAEADGVVLFTPEYNNSIPGVFKNAVDWMSRPAADIPTVFGGRSFAMAGTSPGNFGTQLSQNAWLPVLHTLGAELWSGKRLMIPRAASVFDVDGRIVDEAIAKRLGDFLAAFAAHVRQKAS